MGARVNLGQADISLLERHSISDEELQNSFENIDANLSVLVIDACESGKALDSADPRPGPMDARGLGQLAYDKGMYVLAAAQSREAALEAGGRYGHGLLTYTLIEEGLKTRLPLYDGSSTRLTLRQWFDFAVKRVPELQTKLMQDAHDRNWEIGVVEGEGKIPDPNSRSLQHPRVFYRRDPDSNPVFIGSLASRTQHLK
jgi:hypothetical protein